VQYWVTIWQRWRSWNVGGFVLVNPVGFDILYEQGPCLIVAKPGGVLTQGPPGVDSLEVRVKEYLRQREGKTGNVYLATIHRLDRPVSGLLVMAKHVRAARRIATQFQSRTVEKKYWAAVEGVLDQESGTWTDHVRKIPDVAQAEVVDAVHPDARDAVLRYRVLDVRDGLSWLEIELETGRMHQIRVQAAHRGHPVVGDALYGSRHPFGPEVPDSRARWIALHARSLRFLHPMTREPVFQVAPLPQPWSVWQGIL
jgi:23S rRNA pseudouridine1911/1915/1917 synthase